MEINAASAWQDLETIRHEAPLVHNITNFVVMNSSANALLALGASPVMAHAPEEVCDMLKLSRALVINIGTLSAPWVEAMLLAVQTATELAVPIVFDPVGVGATEYRTNTALSLLSAMTPAVLRGNASEIMALVRSGAGTKGVDSTEASESALLAAQQVSVQYGCVVCVSGAVDIITDGSRVVRVQNGSPLMPRVTGLGCTASAFAGAFCAVNSSRLHAAAHAMIILGIAGEIAAQQASGPGSLQLRLLDVLFALSESDIKQHCRIEME